MVLAKLEGLEDLALFRQCYVIELILELGLGNVGSVLDVSLIRYEVGKLYHFCGWQFFSPIRSWIK